MENIKLFHYKGIGKKAGSVLKGSIVSESKDKAIQNLIKKGVFVTNISQTNPILLKMSSANNDSILLFFDGIAKMLSAGLGITSALDHLINEQINIKITLFLFELKDNIENGMGLTEAIEATKFFPKDVVEIIRVGNESGKIIEVFLNLKELYEQKERIKKAVIGAAAYPIGIILVAIAVIVFLAPKMIEPMKGIYAKFDSVEFPARTQFILDSVKYVKAYGIYFTMFLFLLSFLMVKQYKSSLKFKTIIDNLLVKAPLSGNFIIKLSNYKFLMSLQILYNAGIPVKEAFEMIVDSQGNEIIKEDFQDILDNISEGQNLTSAIKNSKYIPDMTKSLIAIGESTGKLSEQLESLTEFSKKAFNRYTVVIQKAMQPIATLVIGGVIGTIIVAVYLPIFSMMDVLQDM